MILALRHLWKWHHFYRARLCDSASRFSPTVDTSLTLCLLLTTYSSPMLTKVFKLFNFNRQWNPRPMFEFWVWLTLTSRSWALLLFLLHSSWQSWCWGSSARKACLRGIRCKYILCRKRESELLTQWGQHFAAIPPPRPPWLITW